MVFIDKLLSAIEEYNIEILWELAKMNGNIPSIEEFKLMEEEVFSRIYTEIKKDNAMYTYFWEIKEKPKYTEICSKIIENSMDIKEMRKFLNDCKQNALHISVDKKLNIIKKIKDTKLLDELLTEEKYGISQSNLLDAIISMGDINYTDQWIQKWVDKEKHTVFWDVDDIVELIIGMNNLEYTDKCIEKRHDLELKIPHIIDLINGMNDKEYTTKWIEKRDNMHFSLSDVMDLIANLEDKNYTDEWIGRRKELGMNQEKIVKLIQMMNDKEYTDDYIRNRKKFGFTPNQIMRMIIALDDKQFTDDCIERREELNLSPSIIAQLIMNIGDDEYSKKYIKRREELKLSKQNIIDILSQQRNSEKIDYWLERIQELELEPIDIVGLIINNKGLSYIEECLEKHVEEFKFGSREISALLFAIYARKPGTFSENREYLKSVIRKNKSGYNLNSEDIMKLILELGVESFTIEMIENGKEVGLNSRDIELLKFLYNENKVRDILGEKNDNSITKITLPPEMTVGIEIEAIGKYAFSLQILKRLGDWRCKEELSISHKKIDEDAIEFNSPVLKGDNDYRTNSVKNICKVTERFGLYSNESCGGHIHIGADYLTSVKSWENLLELYASVERILYIISNEEGSVPREGIFEYAVPSAENIKERMKENIQNGCIELQDENDLKMLKEEVLKIQGKGQYSRYRGINFQNLNTDKNTIEFRFPNGTVSDKTWIENINLIGGLVKISEELAKIQEKDESKITSQEKIKLECLKKVTRKNSTEKEKLEEFLKLVVPEESIEIYRKRYEINNRLIQQDSMLSKWFDEAFPKEETNDLYESIKNNVILGQSRVKGDEVLRVEQECKVEEKNKSRTM